MSAEVKLLFIAKINSANVDFSEFWIFDLLHREMFAA